MSTRARVICHGNSETNARGLEEEAKGWSWRVLFSSRLFQSWWESKNRFFGLTTVFWPRCSNFRHHFQLSVADRFLSTTLFVVACTEHPENQRQRFVYRFSSTSNRDESYVDQGWKRKKDVSKKCSNYRPTFVKIQMWTQLFRLIFRFVVTSVIPWLGNYRRHASFHATATKPRSFQSSPFPYVVFTTLFRTEMLCVSKKSMQRYWNIVRNAGISICASDIER